MGTGFLQGKASESSPPHQSASQTASPQGEAAGRGRSTALIPFVRNDSPSPPSWGAGRSLRRMQGRRPGYKKSGIPRRISQTRVGRPEGRNSPLWCSFLHFSQEKWRPPAGTPPGRCAPRPLWRQGPKGPLPTGARPPAPLGRVEPALRPNGTASRRRPAPATKKDLANRPGPFCCVIVALDERGIPIRRCPAPS